MGVVTNDYYGSGLAMDQHDRECPLQGIKSAGQETVSTALPEVFTVSPAVRMLALGWMVAGIVLAGFGVDGLFDAPLQKIGRLWLLPLGPTLALLVAGASIMLGRGFWFGLPYAGVLGKAMSLLLFTAAMVPLVSGLMLILAGTINAGALAYVAVGLLGFAVTFFNYRAARAIGV